MAIFKNKGFVRRDYECTNIVYCEAEVAPGGDGVDWQQIESNKFEAGITHLYTENNVRYYGYL